MHHVVRHHGYGTPHKARLRLKLPARHHYTQCLTNRATSNQPHLTGFQHCVVANARRLAKKKVSFQRSPTKLEHQFCLVLSPVYHNGSWVRAQSAVKI